jgi:hypothetical protein
MFRQALSLLRQPQRKSLMLFVSMGCVRDTLSILVWSTTDSAVHHLSSSSLLPSQCAVSHVVTMTCVKVSVNLKLFIVASWIIALGMLVVFEAEES